MELGQSIIAAVSLKRSTRYIVLFCPKDNGLRVSVVFSTTTGYRCMASCKTQVLQLKVPLAAGVDLIIELIMMLFQAKASKVFPEDA